MTDISLFAHGPAVVFIVFCGWLFSPYPCFVSWIDGAKVASTNPPLSSTQTHTYTLVNCTHSFTQPKLHNTWRMDFACTTRSSLKKLVYIYKLGAHTCSFSVYRTSSWSHIHSQRLFNKQTWPCQKSGTWCIHLHNMYQNVRGLNRDQCASSIFTNIFFSSYKIKHCAFKKNNKY